MRGGAVIGIPLTILQAGFHPESIDPWLVANNVAVASAVYDADRLTSSFFALDRLGTRLSALASTAFYASSPATLPIVPMVVGLHLYYTSLKPSIAPIKPFFVALFWTIAVYYVPLLRQSLPLTDDNALAASFFLSIAALSHVADLVDREADAHDHILTPAVRMQPQESITYAFALGFTSILLHTISDRPSVCYDAFLVSTIAGVVTEQVPVAAATAFVCTLVYAATHQAELLSWMLTNSEGVHSVAISLSTTSIERAFHLPEPWRSALIRLLLTLADNGDTMGHQILKAYERAILDRL